MLGGEKRLNLAQLGDMLLIFANWFDQRLLWRFLKMDEFQFNIECCRCGIVDDRGLIPSDLCSVPLGDKS